MEIKKFEVPAEGFALRNLKITNFKGLREVEISFDEHDRIYEITGGNGQGKTSAIEAITCMFFGKKFLPKEAIRHGEEKTTMLGDVGAVTVFRSFDRAGKQSLKILPKDGSEIRSTEEVARELFGSISINASDFKHKSPKEQFDHLLSILPLEIDLVALEANRKAIFETRTSANQQVTNYKAQLELYSDLPAQKPDSVDVTALNEQRRAVMAAERAAHDAIQAHSDHQKLIEAGESHLAALREKLRENEEIQASRKAQLADIESLATKATDVADALPTLEDLDAKAEAAAETNEAVTRWNARASLHEQHKEWADKSAELTDKLDALAQEKREALLGCEMPYPGMEIDLENQVIRLNDVMLKEASDSQQLLVSAAVGMSAETNLHIIHVKGDELDSNSRALLWNMAEAMNFHVISDRCDTSGEVGIVIRDGEVVAENPQFRPAEDVAA